MFFDVVRLNSTVRCELAPMDLINKWWSEAYPSSIFEARKTICFLFDFNALPFPFHDDGKLKDSWRLDLAQAQEADDCCFYQMDTRLMLMGDGEGRTDKIVVNFGEASIWSQSKWLTGKKSELEIMKYLSIVYCHR